MKRKKIYIRYGNRPNLRELFEEMICRKEDEMERSYASLPFMNDINGYDDDDYFGNPNALSADEYFAVMGSMEGFSDYRKGSKSKKGKKKGRLSSFVKGSFPSEDEELGENTIYFYSNYSDKNCRGVFTSIQEFSEYCEANDFHVSKDVSEELCYNKVSHTCLDPFSRSYGHYDLMCAKSYGDMYYNALCMDQLNYDE